MQISNGNANEQLFVTGIFGLGNRFLALAGTTDAESYIVNEDTYKAKKLNNLNSPVKINW